MCARGERGQRSIEKEGRGRVVNRVCKAVHSQQIKTRIVCVFKIMHYLLRRKVLFYISQTTQRAKPSHIKMHSPQNDSPVSSFAKTKHIKQSRQRKLVQAKIGKPSPQQTETSLHEHGNEKWNARNKRLARSFFMTKWGKVILSPTA